MNRTLSLLQLGLMHPENLYPDAQTIVPMLNPMANEDEPGYMPTIDVIRIVKRHRPIAYLRNVAVGRGYCPENTHSTFDSSLDLTDYHFDNAVAVEIACREILDA